MKNTFYLLLLSIIVPAALLTQHGYAQVDSTDAMAETPLAGSVDATADTPLASQPTIPAEQLWTLRLDSLLTDTLFETSQVGITVWDLTADSLLYSRNARQLMRPASTMKLLTAITALDCLGPVYRYTTSLYYKGTISQGRLQGDIICVGGMDPLFERKDMLAFVNALKQKGITAVRGRIIVDTSMKDNNKWGEGWCWDDDNPTLSPLLINRRNNFGDQLLRELRTAGVSVSGTRVVPGQLPATDAVHVCTRSHGIDEVLQQVMKESDNLFAESTYYQIAASTGHHPASARDARQVELSLFSRIGLEGFRYGLADGSGLSLYNYLTAEAETMLLRFAFHQKRIYNALLPTLPVSGVDGTLRARMKETPAEGQVQAKTGTVTGISSLAGYLTASNGHRLCFCIINQGVKRASDGRRFQDSVCIALCTP